MILKLIPYLLKCNEDFDDINHECGHSHIRAKIEKLKCKICEFLKYISTKMSEKRDRGKNYTEQEKELLLALCLREKDVLENKKTDKITVKQKNDVWLQLQKEYNANQVTGYREVRALKILYDNLKKRKARRMKHDGEMDSYKSSEELVSPQMTKMLSSKILSQYHSQFEPIENQYDSSSSYCSDVTAMANHDRRRAADENFPLIITETVNGEGSCKAESEELELSSSNEVIEESARPSRKRKLVYEKSLEICEKKNELSSKSVEFLLKEHEKKMEILEIEKQTALVKLETEKIKKQILEIELTVKLNKQL